MKRFASFCSVTFTVVGLLLASTAVAAEKTAVDPSGTWRWEHDEGGETVKNVLKLNSDGKKVTGTYQGRRGPYEITDGKVDNDKLSFGFNVEYEGQTIEISFVGKIKADTVDGTVSMKSDEGARDYPWTAERGLKTADTVGTWKLSIELPDGNVLTPQLKLSLADDKKELKGEYTSDAAELDVSDIKVKNGKLFFKISGDFGGGTLTANYKVQPRGDKLNGEVEYDFNGQTGELEVTGKRDAEKKEEAK
ncbi:hypothetical protein Pan258_33760 [Symmachiella dynata]|uniref:hypothetical protein n=1 Tax=Symmachiella dynata TaxID=2527995 RepID=UPI00118B3034|nr:hypothetical protein [Symmachiella dynata]QDT49327.1 hypothetical protein Pan258_33760 [Symmachiella dynata]